MKQLHNQRGAVLVFITLMAVILFIMVALGLDSGHLAYIRSQGQPAVDAAALAAASAIPSASLSGNIADVYNRAAAYNATNDYLDSNNNPLANNPSKSITLVDYDANSGGITNGVTMANANGVRVALEMKSPLFLAPLLQLIGASITNTSNVNVSAVAVIGAQPDLPIAVEQINCGAQVGGKYVKQRDLKLLESHPTRPNSAGLTVFNSTPVSATSIVNFLIGAESCVSAPPVNSGFCTPLSPATGVPYDAFNTLFRKDPSRCYFIPVVANGASYSGCSSIVDFAMFCPQPCVDCQFGGGATIGIDKSTTGNMWVYGDVQCGFTPTRAIDARCQVPRLIRDPNSGM